MKSKKANTFSFEMSIENFDFFIKKVNDIIKIYGSVKERPIMISIDKENILMYALVGQGQNIQAFSSFIFKTDDYFNELNAEFEKTNSYKYIAKDGKFLYGKAFNFVSLGEIIEINMRYNEDYYIDLMTLDNKKLNFNFIGSPEIAFPIQISVDAIEAAMDIDKAEFSFNLTKEDFDRIKKIAISGSENDVYYIDIKDGKVKIGESTWTLDIDNTNLEDLEDPVLLPKKYFHSLTFDKNNTDVTFYVFDIFLLAKSDTTNLFMSRETIIK